MSEVLARIRVQETHGIRRFLYPLTEVITLPRENANPEAVHLETAAGEPVPCQITLVDRPPGKPQSAKQVLRVDFAVSLAPLASLELHLLPGAPTDGLVSDPLVVSEIKDDILHNQQQQFQIDLGPSAIQSVVYDGIAHLSGPNRITRNGYEMQGLRLSPTPSSPLYAIRQATGQYTDGCMAFTHQSLTACKSWINIIHGILSHKPNDEVVFTLPLAVASPTLLCDFGVGGGIYAKLQADTAKTVVWTTEFGEDGRLAWSLATDGRVDYTGKIASAEAFLAQRWFHVIDGTKALAVAITQMPDHCTRLTVTLTHHGEVRVAFRLGDEPTMNAWFDLCYHFLNDVPAIAAATNPQSILLVPTVEVLTA